MKPPFAFIEEHISHDTVETLKTLLARAESGEIIGIAYSVMNKKRSYNVDSAGEFVRNPTYAIGTTMILIYRLLKKVVQ